MDNNLDVFENFFTAEDEFKLEMESYIPEFLQRMADDTMKEPEFVERTLELMKLGKESGIDMQQYIINFGKANGLK
ncbi:MAG: hypothetical protein K2H19_00035 [Ruminococcus sp.]|nr:hypothetical protein [Ruminococcus sp.]